MPKEPLNRGHMTLALAALCSGSLGIGAAVAQENPPALDAHAIMAKINAVYTSHHQESRTILFDHRQKLEKKGAPTRWLHDAGVIYQQGDRARMEVTNASETVGGVSKPLGETYRWVYDGQELRIVQEFDTAGGARQVRGRRLKTGSLPAQYRDILKDEFGPSFMNAGFTAREEMLGDKSRYVLEGGISSSFQTSHWRFYVNPDDYIVDRVEIEAEYQESPGVTVHSTSLENLRTTFSGSGPARLFTHEASLFKLDLPPNTVEVNAEEVVKNIQSVGPEKHQ